MTRSYSLILSRLALLAGGLALLPSCSTTKNEYAYLRIINLSADSPALDVYAADGTEVATNLAFQQVTSYTETNTGTYTFSVGTASSSPVQVLSNLSLNNGTYNTIYLYNLVAQIAGGAYVQDQSILSSSDFSFRVTNVADTVSAIGVTLSTTPLTQLYTNLLYGNAGNPFQFEAGTYNLGVDLTGGSNPTLQFDLPNIGTGQYQEAFFVGNDTGGGTPTNYNLVLVNSSSQTTVLNSTTP